ncbi:MAG: hypothetical protein NZ516_11695, partial [Raineya sp.]|nr:hypothetical protein [Raineya sp.]
MANAKELIEKNLQTQHPILDLGNCGLNGKEPELDLLAECTHLHTLIFSNRWYEFDRERKRWLLRVSQNIGNRNELVQVPSKLPPNLKKLVIEGYWGCKWKIHDLSPLQGLKQLQILNLSQNQISDLSPLQELN